MTERRRIAWTWLKRGLTLAFFAVVGTLLYVNAREIEWGEVMAATASLPVAVLVTAGALCVLSYALFCSFDLLGRHYTGHALPRRRVVLVNFISYAFNLNLGSLIGGVAFRYRLYSRLGLDNATITRIVSLSMLTNWLGYVLLAGALFVLAPLALPESWPIDGDALRLLGVALVAVAAAYLALCAWRPGHVWHLRGHAVSVPGARLALLQLVLSCINWSVMGAVIWVLLRGQVAYADVLSVLLVAAIAGVMAHVPAGLGVLEAVFIALLGSQVPRGELLAALLAYRAMYYLLPLGVATVAYAITESRARSMRVDGTGDERKPRDARPEAGTTARPRRAAM